MKRLLMIPAVLLALGASVASANDVVVGPIYTPLVTPPPVGQTVYYGAPPPAVAQTTYYAPAPVTVVPAPVYTYRPTIVRGPVVAYSPVAPTVTYSPVAPAPVVAYSPVVAAPAYGVAAPVMVPAGRPVTVSTKVYVPGQPVRNFFKAVTP